MGKQKYREQLVNFFESNGQKLYVALLDCIETCMIGDVDYLDLAYYPESFTESFEVYPWPIQNGEIADIEVVEGFDEVIFNSLDSDLNPSDLDFDYRVKIFRSVINEHFSDIYDRIRVLKGNTLDVYLFVPDDSKKWSLGTRKAVLNDRK